MKLPILLLFQSNAQTTVENIWDLLSDKQFSRNEIQHIIMILGDFFQKIRVADFFEEVMPYHRGQITESKRKIV